MTISVYLKDANFTNFIASTAPQPNGLQILIRPRLNSSTSEMNEAFNKNDVVQNGSPTYNDYFASELNSTNFYQSDFAPANGGEATYIALMREPQASSGFMGNFLHSDSKGDLLDYISGTGTFRAFNNGKSASIVLPSVDPVKFRVLFASFKPLETTLGYSSGGILTANTSSSTEDRAVTTDRGVRLGWNYSGANSDNDAAAFLVWDRALTLAEIKEVYEWLIDVYGSNLDID